MHYFFNICFMFYFTCTGFGQIFLFMEVVFKWCSVSHPSLVCVCIVKSGALHRAGRIICFWKLFLPTHARHPFYIWANWSTSGMGLEPRLSGRRTGQNLLVQWLSTSRRSGTSEAANNSLSRAKFCHLASDEKLSKFCILRTYEVELKRQQTVYSLS